MTRHARNCTAGAVYTYNEKKKDANQSGYGTSKERLGKDSLRNFDCCCLSLQPCKNPVITQEGFLYDKESILEYFITKKNEYSRRLKEYEKEKRREEDELTAAALADRSKEISEFKKQENDIIVPSSQAQAIQRKFSPETSVSNMAPGKEGNVPSFWIPSKTPQAKKSTITKPDKTIFCPMSGKPLKIKDLIPVKFTEIKDIPSTSGSSGGGASRSSSNANGNGAKSLIAKEERYMCPVTRDTLSNSIQCAVIRTTGDVVTMDCVEKIIKKDWMHPLTGDKIEEKDIILVQRGGTGFSSTNINLQAEEKRPSIQV